MRRYRNAQARMLEGWALHWSDVARIQERNLGEQAERTAQWHAEQDRRYSEQTLERELARKGYRLERS